MGIVGRSYGDWARGKQLPTKEGVKILSDKFEIPIPRVLEEREEWWSGRVNGKEAARIKFEKYGYYGKLTSKDRAKGGRATQKKLSQNPEYYRSLGLKVKNNFTVPERSESLAEFLGIVLGDGGLTKDQCQISLHLRDDKQYADYLTKMIETLFGYTPSIYPCEKHTDLCFGFCSFA